MSSNTFYAKLRCTGDQSESALLTFPNAAKAEEWWQIILKSNWSGSLQIIKGNAKRSNPQWFTWPKTNSSGGTKDLLKSLENANEMKSLKGEWDWKMFDEGAEPVIPVQDAQGNVTPDSEALQKKIDELEAKLGAGSTGADNNGAGNQALVSSTGGSNWVGGARFQGGPQHYAMASDAFKMALDCKDRGDSRSFNMIFSQLFMEQRRTVGVPEKESPEGGYNSAQLISDIYSKAKELQDRGDDRPFGLIFGSLSMAYRRGKILW